MRKVEMMDAMRDCSLRVLWVVAIAFFGISTAGVAADESAFPVLETNPVSRETPAGLNLISNPPVEVALQGDSEPAEWSHDLRSQAQSAAQPVPSSWMAQADNAEAPPEPETSSGSGLEITLNVDWVSKYMFRGFDVLDDHAAWQPSVDIALWDSGFHVNWWASLAATSRNDPDIVNRGLGRELDEFDYTLYWEGSIGDCVDVELGTIYYDLFRQDSEKLDFVEWYGTFTLSKLPLSPYFGAYYGTPKHRANGGEGWMTTLGVSQSVNLCGLTFCGSDPLSLDLTADVWYNGGEFVDGVDPGWSHATFGGSIPISLPHNFTFTAGVYYQLSMEDTVNPEDEWWATLSLEYAWK